MEQNLHSLSGVFPSMSGRLIILPKKSYCPWKPENVERVLRDERKHKEEQEAMAKSELQRESQTRLQALKGNVTSERFSLFEAEERAEKMAVNHAPSQTSAQAKGPAGMMPMYSTQDERRIDRKRPFYLQEHPFSVESTNEKDDALKRNLDPMSSFARERAEVAAAKTTLVVRDTVRHGKRKESPSEDNNSSDDKRKRRRSRVLDRKKHTRERKRSRKSSAISLDELRRRRLEREGKEGERVTTLVLNSTVDMRKGKYQDQFNPTLTRR